MDLSDLVIVTQRELGRVEWQASIDREVPAVPLNLTDADWTSAGVPATFGGRSVLLRLAPLDVSTLPRPPGEPYRHALVVNGRGDLRSSAASLAAALAYASAAGGAGYVPATGEVKAIGGLRPLLAAMLAAIADAGPGDRGTASNGTGGSTVIRARRAQ